MKLDVSLSVYMAFSKSILLKEHFFFVWLNQYIFSKEMYGKIMLTFISIETCCSQLNKTVRISSWVGRPWLCTRNSRKYLMPVFDLSHTPEQYDWLKLLSQKFDLSLFMNSCPVFQSCNHFVYPLCF